MITQEPTTDESKTISEAKPAALGARHLQPLLVDLLALRLQAKQAHWNVRGPHFRDVHLELDETVDELDVATDRTAERLVALGSPADGAALTISQHASIAAFPAGFVRDLDALATLALALEVTIEAARQALVPLEADPVTQDLVIGIVHDLEKRRWMFRSRMA